MIADAGATHPAGCFEPSREASDARQRRRIGRRVLFGGLRVVVQEGRAKWE